LTDVRRLALILTWPYAVIAVGAGALLHSCVLAASVGVFALGAFYVRMDHSAPGRPVAAAIACIGAGLACSAISMVLWLMVAGAAVGWWPAQSGAYALIATLLIVLLVVLRIRDDAQARSRRVWVTVAFAIVVASTFGIPIAECSFAAVVAIVLAHQGWHLMRGTASNLLRGG